MIIRQNEKGKTPQEMVMEILDRSTDQEDAKRALFKFAGDNDREEKRGKTEKDA